MNKTRQKLPAVSEEIVLNKIYHIRHQKVMLDSDLADLYGVETKQLKRQVKRNLDRFPDDFMFELNKEEFEILRCQSGTSSIKWGGTRYMPMAFTEQGVAMLSSVLGSPQAIQVNIGIMRVFTRVRQMLVDHTDLRLAVEEMKKQTTDNTQNIEIVFRYLDELLQQNEADKKRRPIGYKMSGTAAKRKKK